MAVAVSRVGLSLLTRMYWAVAPPLGMAVSMLGLLLLTAGSGMVMFANVMYPKNFPAPCLRGLPHSPSCSRSPLPVCLRNAPVELPATGGSQPAQDLPPLGTAVSMVGLLLLTAGSGMVMCVYPKNFPAPCLRGLPHSPSCSCSPLPVCLRNAPVELPATGGSQPAQDWPPLGTAVSMVGLLLLTAGSGMVMYAKVTYPKDFLAPLPVCLRKAPVELPATGGSQPAHVLLVVVVVPVTKIPVSPSSVPPCRRYNRRDSIPAGL